MATMWSCLSRYFELNITCDIDGMAAVTSYMTRMSPECEFDESPHYTVAENRVRTGGTVIDAFSCHGVNSAATIAANGGTCPNVLFAEEDCFWSVTDANRLVHTIMEDQVSGIPLPNPDDDDDDDDFQGNSIVFVCDDGPNRKAVGETRHMIIIGDKGYDVECGEDSIIAVREIDEEEPTEFVEKTTDPLNAWTFSQGPGERAMIKAEKKPPSIVSYSDHPLCMSSSAGNMCSFSYPNGEGEGFVIMEKVKPPVTWSRGVGIRY